MNLKLWGYVTVMVLLSAGLAKAESSGANGVVPTPGFAQEGDSHNLVPNQDEPLLKLEDLMPDVDGTSNLPQAINRNCPPEHGAVSV